MNQEGQPVLYAIVTGSPTAVAKSFQQQRVLPR